MTTETQTKKYETGEERLTRLQRERVERALTEGERYGLTLDSSGAFAWCFNPKSGKFYRVTETSCTCEDFKWRSGPAGLACKHIACYVARQEAGK